MIEFDSRRIKDRRKTSCFVDPDRRNRSDRRGRTAEVKLKSAARFEERETLLLQIITTPEERQQRFHSQVFISTLQDIAARARKTK